MTEKTYPIHVGEAERDMILAIQGKVKDSTGYEVTQRAVATRAVTKLYGEIFPKVEG